MTWVKLWAMGKIGHPQHLLHWLKTDWAKNNSPMKCTLMQRAIWSPLVGKPNAIFEEKRI
jgi:hypothetical protein